MRKPDQFTDGILCVLEQDQPKHIAHNREVLAKRKRIRAAQQWKAEQLAEAKQAKRVAEIREARAKARAKAEAEAKREAEAEAKRRSLIWEQTQREAKIRAAKLAHGGIFADPSAPESVRVTRWTLFLAFVRGSK